MRWRGLWAPTQSWPARPGPGPATGASAPPRSARLPLQRPAAPAAPTKAARTARQRRSALAAAVELCFRKIAVPMSLATRQTGGSTSQRRALRSFATLKDNDMKPAPRLKQGVRATSGARRARARYWTLKRPGRCRRRRCGRRRRPPSRSRPRSRARPRCCQRTCTMRHACMLS